MNTRCKTGKRLIREWSNSIKLAPTAEIANHLLVAPRKYDRHIKRCKICGSSLHKGDKNG